MNQNQWDLVIIQGFYNDFFGAEYDSLNPKTTPSKRRRERNAS